MSSSSDQWYAKLGVGIEFGPMPHDDLIDLAKTGQLLESDEVREGPDGEWSAVRDRPGLLDCINPTSPAAIPDDEPPPSGSGSAPVAAIPEDAAVEQGSASSSPQPDAIPIAQSLVEFEVVAGQSSQTCEIRESSGTDVTSSDELDFELNLPESSPTDVADSVPNPEAANRATRPKLIPDQTNELDFELNLPPQPPAAPAETAGLASFTDPPQLPARANPRTRSFEPEPAENQEASSPTDTPAPPAIVSELPHPPSTSGGAEQAAAVDLDDSKPVARRRVTWPRVPRVVSRAGTVAFVLCLVWWLLPGPERDIYADYLAIYQELQDRQSNPDGQAGWSEFVNRSRARIDEANPWLEETAQPGDREKNLLLYAGRDMQKMLEHSPDTTSAHQQRLDGFFEQLAEIYEPAP